jgi:hypothetical protein
MLTRLAFALVLAFTAMQVAPAAAGQQRRADPPSNWSWYPGLPGFSSGPGYDGR